MAEPELVAQIAFAWWTSGGKLRQPAARDAATTSQPANFTAGKSDDFMNHGLQPLGDAFPTVANVFVALDTDRPVSAVQVLLAALLAPYHNGSQASSAYSDLARVTRELAHPSNLEYDYGAYLKAALAVLVSALERGAASPASLEPLIEATNMNLETHS